MSYANLSDDLLQKLEASGVSRDARLLHIEGIVHCATVLSDGEIRIRLARITDAEDPDECASELVQAGLWSRDGNHYRILNYLRSEGGHQRSAEEKRKADESHARRQAEYEERGRRHASGDHRTCTSKCPQAGQHLRSPDASGDASSDVLVPSPVLSDKKGGQDKGKGSADGALERAPAEPDDEEVDEKHLFTDSCCELPATATVHVQGPPALLEMLSHMPDAYVECPDDDARLRFDNVQHRIELNKHPYFWRIYANSRGIPVCLEAHADTSSGVTEAMLGEFRLQYKFKSCRVGTEDNECFLIKPGRSTIDDVNALLALPEYIAARITQGAAS